MYNFVAKRIMKFLAIIILVIFTACSLWSQSDLKTEYFFKALKEQNYQKIDQYLTAGIDINAPKIEMGHYKGDNFISNQSRTPLLYAIELNQPKLVEFLITKGANVNQELEVFRYEVCEDCGWSRKLTQTYHKKNIIYKPMEWALNKRNIDIIKVLINNGADYTGLEESVMFSAEASIWKYFTEKGMKLQFSEKHLFYAYETWNYPEVVELLENGLTANTQTLNNMIERKDTMLLRLAVENGSDVNGFYSSKALKMCPLCKAVFQCNIPLTKLLIEKYNANPNVVCSFYSGSDFFKGTPLDLSQFKWGGKCKGRSDEMTEYLLLLK